jgi:hypothetical protein
MFARFFRSSGGNVAVISAVAMVPIMAGVVGAVDLVMMDNKASEVQNALDAAGLAIGTRFLEGASDQQLAIAGEEHFRGNLQHDAKLSASFSFSRPSSDDELALATAAETPVNFFSVASDITYLGMIATADLLQARRRTIVKVARGKPACLLALNKNASSAVKIQGSTKVDMKGCVLAANSRASDAVSRGGTATLAAECVYSSGGTSGLISNSNAKLKCGKPWENQYPASDPLAGVVPPDYPGCKYAPGGKQKELSPGFTYCDKSLSGEITLKPGTYVFRGTSIKLGGNGSLTGTGVTIFLLQDASLSFGANEVVNLSPPESGPYAGITIYQEAANTNALTLQGGVGTNITGFVYAPGAHVQFAGNSDTTGTPGCIRLIGDTIEMTGTSDIALDCEKQLGGRKMTSGRYISIVR